MINTLLGIKEKMTSTYDARGRRVGATVVKITPNFITGVKFEEGKDRYDAVQIGFGNRKSLKKPQAGQLKKAGVKENLRYLKEVRIRKGEKRVKEDDLGKEVTLGDVFNKGDAVKVTGTSKGKGFAGVVKRHGFAGGPKTHGQSDRHRAPGSIGQTTTPGRVYRGKKMAGHMGVAKVSVRGLEVVGVDKKEHLLTVKGGVPGPFGGLVIVQKLGKIKGYTPPPEEKEDEKEEKVAEKTQETQPESEQAAQGEEKGESK